ncbi:MAG: phosphatidylglycerol lysyltransferase domain-containing protein [Candidatus Aminicenantes bacterium]|nr:phosphatidylglycerol lysyltransferase domain-containing protein [Candidatus Aminicenantes bacterium]
MAVFPEFKPLGLEDRPLIQSHLWSGQPETSELTFTNLYIWRTLYRWQWSVDGGCLLLLGQKEGQDPFFLQPVCPGPRLGVSRRALDWLRRERGGASPRIERADAKFVSELSGEADFEITPLREHFDYIYDTSDLSDLKGGKYHAKRNHINRFLQNFGRAYEFRPIGPDNLSLCLDFQERWCELKRCAEDMNLLDEWEAVRAALADYESLKVNGAAIQIEGKVEAFTFGELLNSDTAVVHIEKANPEIPGLYALINQRFCQTYWSSVPFINREQDLDEEGLRKAKLSYHPVRLVEKYRVEKIS